MSCRRSNVIDLLHYFLCPKNPRIDEPYAFSKFVEALKIVGIYLDRICHEGIAAELRNNDSTCSSSEEKSNKE